MTVNYKCDAAFVNQTFDYTNRSVIERSIVFDWQNFIVNDWCSIGFDCRTVRLDRSGLIVDLLGTMFLLLSRNKLRHSHSVQSKV